MSEGIAKNAAVVGFMTLVSRVGGLVREILMANFFGAGMVKSAFDVAYRIPNLFRRLFGEGALSAALIPVYTETLEREGKQEADRLAAAVAGIVTAVLGILSVLGILLTFAIAAAFNLDERWLSIFPLLRIMLPYAPLICLAALVMGVLNSLKSFAIPALAPAFQNLCCIIALAAICPFLPAHGPLRIKVVSWSILVSGIVQVAVQLPVLKRHGVPLALAVPRHLSAGVKRVFALTAPMAFSAGIVQINVCLDSILAMKAGIWGPSALNYADRIVYLPLAIVGTAFSTVLLPTLSSFATKGEYGEFANSFSRSLRSATLVMAPASAGMIALAIPIVSFIYETGAFNYMAVMRTSAALVAYAAGLVPAGIHKIAVTAFYARKDAKTPMIVGTIGVFLNLAMNLFFIWVLPKELKPVGIAIATAISSTIASIALLAILAQRKCKGSRLFAFASVCRTFLMSLVMAIAMGVLCKVLSDGIRKAFVSAGFDPYDKLALLCALSAAIPAGAVAYFGLTRLACPAELKELLADLGARRRRRRASGGEA